MISDETPSQVPEAGIPQDSPSAAEPPSDVVWPDTEAVSKAAADNVVETPADAKVDDAAVKATPPPPSSPPPVKPVGDIDDNARLMAALAYFLWFIGPAIILLSPSLNVRPHLRYHAVQALGLNVVLAITSFVLLVMAFVFCCIGVLLLIPLAITVYYTVMAYQAKDFRIPIVTNVMIAEGWLKPN